MKSEAWHRSLRAGQFCSVAIPFTPPIYGYALIHAAPIQEDIEVTLYQRSLPEGQHGTIPVGYIIATISPEQFRAAKQCGFPPGVREGMVLTRQLTNQLGIA